MAPPSGSWGSPGPRPQAAGEFQTPQRGRSRQQQQDTGVPLPPDCNRGEGWRERNRLYIQYLKHDRFFQCYRASFIETTSHKTTNSIFSHAQLDLWKIKPFSNRIRDWSLKSTILDGTHHIIQTPAVINSNMHASKCWELTSVL